MYSQVHLSNHIWHSYLSNSREMEAIWNVVYVNCKLCLELSSSSPEIGACSSFSLRHVHLAVQYYLSPSIFRMSILEIGSFKQLRMLNYASSFGIFPMTARRWWWWRWWYSFIHWYRITDCQLIRFITVLDISSQWKQSGSQFELGFSGISAYVYIEWITFCRNAPQHKPFCKPNRTHSLVGGTKGSNSN